MPRALVCAAALAICPPAFVSAGPQDQADGGSASRERIKVRLEEPIQRSLTKSVPVQLRPVFKSQVEKHPFVMTLEEDLHKTFDLNALQRQSADWAGRCCGFDLGILFNAIEKAAYERKVRKTREQIR